jgi:hypothetical protein
MNWKQIGIYLAIAIVAGGAVFGIRALRIQNIETKLEQVELVNGLLPESILYKGERYLIPPAGVFETGTTNEDMPAINAPEMVSIPQADAVLSDVVDGIVVEKDGEARFYSLQILRWHEVVNDEIGGDKIAVTHCSLCHTSNVFDRMFDGEELNLSISGLVYSNITLLEDDQTNTLWLQGRGDAVMGGNLGEALDVYDHSVMTWEMFKDAYPDGVALSLNTGYEFDYGLNPYLNYDASETLYFPLLETPEKLGLKWLMNGVQLEEGTVAFSHQIMAGFGSETVTVGEETIVGLFDHENGETNVFRQPEEVITFVYDFDTEELRDEETGSLWTSAGLAIEGEREGLQLEPVHAQEIFWFCWYTMYPETIVAKIDI